MILICNIKNLASEQMFLGDNISVTNKTELFNFLRSAKELKSDQHEILQVDEQTNHFYLEDENGVVYEAFIQTMDETNSFKNKLVKFLLDSKTFFKKFKEELSELPKASAHAIHR